MKCANCTADLSPGDTFCRECGHPVSPGATPSMTVVEDVHDAAYCTHCGYPITPRPRRRWGKIIGLVVSVLLGVAFLAGMDVGRLTTPGSPVHVSAGTSS